MSEERSVGEYTFDILVEHPAGDCNRYVHDEHARNLRLAEVLHPAERFPADRGIVPETLTSDGEPLAVVLLVTQPNFPGARVQARPLALLEPDDDASAIIVAVPTVDPYFATYRDLGDLVPQKRQAIAALFAATSLNWQDASKAVEYVRAGRERAAWARIEATKGRYLGRAWQAERLARSDSSSDVHTAAEHDLRALPFRFQCYVADCLFPDERILLFVTRPSISVASSGLSFWRPRRLQEGILVVTDRQVLWMVDALPPDATLVQWGYVAQVGAIERLESVVVDQASEHGCINLTFAARGGVEVIRVEFPHDRHSLLVEVAKLLERFIPSPPTRAVRRIYRLEPGALPSRLSATGHETDSDRVPERLRAAALETLSEGEFAAAMAYIPSGHDRPVDRLIVATNHRMIMVEARRNVSCTSHLICDLTSVTLRNSLVSCAFEFRCSAKGTLERVSIPFDYPQRDTVLDVFSAIRQVLGQPHGAAPCTDARAKLTL
jgi:inorganic pyrophosphatase